MTAVLISGTFKKDDRPDNGLESIYEQLVRDEFTPRLVVALVVPHAYKKTPGEQTIPTVKIRAIEPVDGDDAVIVRGLIDKQRAARDGAPLEMTLFDAENLPDDDDEDSDTVPEAFDAEGWAAEGKA